MMHTRDQKRGWVLVLIGFLWGVTRAAAQVPRTPPTVTLVICEGLTWAEVRNATDFPHLAHFAEQGAVGLMSNAVNGPKTLASARLTLTTGQHASASADLPRLAAVSLDTLLQTVQPPIRVASFGSQEEGTEEPTPKIQNPKSKIQNPERPTPLFTPGWWGESAVQSEELYRLEAGQPFGRVDDFVRMAQRVEQNPDGLRVIHLGDLRRLERMGAWLSPVAYRQARQGAVRRLSLLLWMLQERAHPPLQQTDIVLISLPPPTPDGRSLASWERLTPIIAWGPHFPPGLLTSATTRTPGLVSNTDIAPTILRLYGVAPPTTMTGRPLQVLTEPHTAAERLALVARKDYVTTLNLHALTRAVLPLGGLCLVLTLAAMLARRRGGGGWGQRLAPGVLFTQSLPMGLLLAPLWVPPTLWEYGLRMMAWMAGLTLLCLWMARRIRLAPPIIMALVSLALLMGDTLTGQSLQKDSLLCGYPLSGIRYYGVGNEYLGVLLGFALVSGFLLLEPVSPSGRRFRLLRAALLIGWLCLALILGWPGWGANAGSLAATGAGFSVGAALLSGKRPNGWLFLSGVVGGLLLAFGFGTWEMAQASREAAGGVSHLGAAMQSASGGRGFGYLGEIMLRKVAMNLRILLSPWLLLAAVTVFGTALLIRTQLGDLLAQTWRRHPGLTQSLRAVTAALIASLLFKDSGVVTATFLAGSVCVMVLWYLLTEAESA